MKSFCFSLAALIVITVFVVFSSVYIGKFCDEMVADIKALPVKIDDDTIESFTEHRENIYKIWNKSRGYIRCTVGHTDAEEIDSALEEMTSRFSSGDLSGYLSARSRLISLTEELEKAEKFGWYALG